MMNRRAPQTLLKKKLIQVMTQSQVRKVQTPVKKDQCSNSCKGPVAKEIIIPGNDDICLGNILIGTNKYVFRVKTKLRGVPSAPAVQFKQRILHLIIVKSCLVSWSCVDTQRCRVKLGLLVDKFCQGTGRSGA